MNISFEAFFGAVWGYAPYPWQSELSRVVHAEGWPDVIDIPTGAGKTAVLDIALHHFIVDGGRNAPRRILIVVDRRIVVDQAGMRGRTLLEALANPEDARSPTDVAILTKARDSLGAIVGNGAPFLHTTVLRGGTMRSDAWAAYPHTPVLGGSTVDQLGSRLFFRGYGVSDRMRSVHAGLLGCDTLVLLDEVHLARPFADVLGQLGRIRERGSSEVRRRLQVVQLSATPGKAILGASVDEPSESRSEAPEPLGAEGEVRRRRKVLRLQAADRNNRRLAMILQASKPAELERVEVKARSGEDVKRRTVAERAAWHAREMLGEGRRAVAVVLNRVDTARRAWTALQDEAFDAILITGRMRPLDQVEAVRRIKSRVSSDRPEDREAKPLVVVATQCIEAGADYDFDGLVAECAPLDALRQRFGRLDRTGRYRARARSAAAVPAHPPDVYAEAQVPGVGNGTARAGIAARAVILMRSDYLGAAVDPVYGRALSETWEWLITLAGGGPVDFGIDALEHHLQAAGESLEGMLTPSRPAPVLLPAYLDQWMQTNPAPYADPDVSLFLHGIPEDARSAVPDVQVVWRSDLSEEDLSPGAADTDIKSTLDHLAIVPPGSLEAISLPVWTVKRWLSGDDRAPEDDDVADIEGTTGRVDEEQPAPARGVLIWKGKGHPHRRRKRSELTDAGGIEAGDTIVVPEVYGGIGPHGTFDPDVRAGPGRPPGPGLVYDLGDAVQWRQRGRPTLRLGRQVLEPIVGLELAKLSEVPDVDVEEVDVIASLSEAVRTLQETAPDRTPAWFQRLLDAANDRGSPVLREVVGSRSVAFRPTWKRRVRGLRLSLPLLSKFRLRQGEMTTTSRASPVREDLRYCRTT